MRIIIEQNIWIEKIIKENKVSQWPFLINEFHQVLCDMAIPAFFANRMSIQLPARGPT
jgi:hypothetical protein